MAPFGTFFATSAALFSTAHCEPQPPSRECAPSSEMTADMHSFLQNPQHEQSLLQSGAVRMSAKVSEAEVPAGRFAESKAVDSAALPDGRFAENKGVAPVATAPSSQFLPADRFAENKVVDDFEDFPDESPPDESPPADRFAENKGLDSEIVPADRFAENKGFDPEAAPQAAPEVVPDDIDWIAPEAPAHQNVPDEGNYIVPQLRPVDSTAAPQVLGWPDRSTPPLSFVPDNSRRVHLDERAFLNPLLQVPLTVALPDLPMLVPTPDLGAPGPHVTDDEASRVTRLLQAADRARSQFGFNRDSGTVQNSFAEAIQAIENRRPNDATFIIVNTYHDTLIRAIDLLEAHLPEEEAASRDLTVTIDFLRAVHGLDRVPELAKGNVLGGEMVEADMLAFPGGLSLLREAAQGGRRQLPHEDLWSGGHVPFCIAPGTALPVRRAFADAIAEVTSLVPCITFEEVAWVSGSGGDPVSLLECNAPRAVFLQSPVNSGCYANVGAPGDDDKVAVLNLDPWDCTTTGVAIHEVLHTLGMFHEQQRGDRDQLIDVIFDNIREDSVRNYEIADDADTRVNYDPFSIMHYGDTTFGKLGPDGNPLQTMRFKADAPYSGEDNMGQRFGMSQNDIEQLALMYTCVDGLSTRCTYDQSECTTGDCTCPPGSLQVEAHDGCHRCTEECPADPDCHYNPDCGCVAPAYKRQVVSGNVDACFTCAVPQPCPEGNGFTADDTCTCADPLVRKSQRLGGETYYRCAPEFEECAASPACLSDASCVCSTGMKTQMTSTSGGVCYSCHEECPDAPAAFPGAPVCTNDGGCPCAAGKVRSLLQVDGATCVGCRTTEARISRNGCECKASWSYASYGISVEGDYCDDEYNICMPVDPSCEAEGGNPNWYAYCADAY